MFQIVLVCVLCAMVVAGGVLAWWIDNGGNFSREKENNEVNVEKGDE